MHCIRVHTKGLSHTLIFLIRKVYWKEETVSQSIMPSRSLVMIEFELYALRNLQASVSYLPYWRRCIDFLLFSPPCLLQNGFKCFSIPLRLILLKFWSDSKIKKKLNIITLGRVPWISVSYSPNVSLGKVKSISFPGVIEQTMQYH